VTLELSVEPGLPSVPAVAGELNQVWLNLVDNAIDAAPEGGHVTLQATRKDGSVLISVIDDGHGIPPEMLDSIFEPFFTTKPVGEGTGMGLDIVLGIVHRHNGTIEPTSRPGRTEFRVTLPAVEAQP
jgi:signal transduction histidine kinase